MVSARHSTERIWKNLLKNEKVTFLIISYLYSAYNMLYLCGQRLIHSPLPPLSRLQTLNSCWTFAQNYGIMHSAIAGIVHRLVYQPSKLRRWVRFPLPAPSFLDAGSSRISVFLYALAPLLAPLSIFAAEKGFISAQRKKAPFDRFGSKGALLLYALYADFLLSLILCKRVRTNFGASRKWSPTFA